MSAKLSDTFAKAVSAALAESKGAMSLSPRKVSSCSTTKTELVLERKVVDGFGDRASEAASDSPSTSASTASTASKTSVEIDAVNKENSTAAVVVTVKQLKKEEGQIRTLVDAAKSKAIVATLTEEKKVEEVKILTSVAVVQTRDGTLSHLLSLIIDRAWKRVLNLELRKEYMHEIIMFLEKEKAKGVQVFPPRDLIFNAFNLTPLNKVRVVLLGQDPYHDINQAHGLCFSVNKGVRPPPSLLNMYKELKNDIPLFKIPDHGCLVSWARQGVFMLNATLTVEAHKANSHSNIGWQKFTDEVIRIISRECKGVVFLLWGGFAHKKEALVDRKKHVIIKTAHPSPLSARLFFGCRCFSKTNEALVKFGRPPIDWKAF